MDAGELPVVPTNQTTASDLLMHISTDACSSRRHSQNRTQTLCAEMTRAQTPGAE